MTHSDVSVPYLVVGTGIAGLVTALECAESSKVLLVSKSILGESNTRYAQGGIAAAWGRTDDCEQHLTTPWLLVAIITLLIMFVF